MTQADIALRTVYHEILAKGKWYRDDSREDTHRLQIPRIIQNFSREDGFVAMTSRELKLNSVITELVWFLRGDTNISYLVKSGNPIWNKDAYNWYKKVCEEHNLYPLTYKSFIDAIKQDKTMKDLMLVHGGYSSDLNYELGDVGNNYSKQWRDYAGKVDQVAELIENMRTNIMSTRLKVEAWNPAELKKTTLPPCHTGFQIVGEPLSISERFALTNFSEAFIEDAIAKDLEYEALEGVPSYGFYLYWDQRSVDSFLGLPFNMASYNLLALFLEAATGHRFLGFGSDLKCVHLYDNSIEAAKRFNKIITSHEAPRVTIELGDLIDQPGGEILSSINKENFIIEDYTSEEAFTVEMKAPTKV